MKAEEISKLAMDALDELKGVNIVEIDVRGRSSVTDFMVIASGTSDRHLRSLGERVVERAKQAGIQPLGIEGGRDNGWVLVDLFDVVIHIMRPDVREFYSLEKLWAV
ncbi:MAG: ribosome-associated protein [Halothiobacillaceae bacterium]|nr:MAG: ribosome-associated protein [Halothiobacillaceae bacterium]